MDGDRGIKTVPNAISVVRLLAVPVFVWLLAADHRIAAFALLAALGASDWVDGWIARRYDQASEVGKVLDPTADRILLITAGVSLLVDGSVPLVVGLVVLVREAIVSLAVLGLAIAGARRVDVQWAGKAGTLAIMFAFPRSSSPAPSHRDTTSRSSSRGCSPSPERLSATTRRRPMYPSPGRRCTPGGVHDKPHLHRGRQPGRRRREGRDPRRR